MHIIVRADSGDFLLLKLERKVALRSSSLLGDGLTHPACELRRKGVGHLECHDMIEEPSRYLHVGCGLTITRMA